MELDNITYSDFQSMVLDYKFMRQYPKDYLNICKYIVGNIHLFRLYEFMPPHIIDNNTIYNMYFDTLESLDQNFEDFEDFESDEYDLMSSVLKN